MRIGPNKQTDFFKRAKEKGQETHIDSETHTFVHTENP